MSSRGEKRREKQRTPKQPAKRWKPIEISEWVLRIVILLLILALPWYYGSVQWKSQYVLAWVGVSLCGCIAIHALISVFSKAGDVTVPWLTWLFFAVAFFAFLQSVSVFSWQGKGFVPSSVSMQRWALGLEEAPQAIAGSVLPSASSAASATAGVSSVPCDLKEVPEAERRLAWSVEPLHTRGGVAALVLCGLFVWLGRMAFTGSSKQLWLFGAMTAIGILIACVGVQGAVSYRSENFLGLKSGGSFATFVSKNSAGGFYNICIAGCLGLLGWTLLNTQRTAKDTRYRFPDTNIIGKIRGFAEDSLADLNTAQIAAALCLISIVSALLISLCRGAAVSALGAIIVASIIANAKSRSRGGWAISFAVATAFLACMIGFQIDDRAYSRLESLSEIDIEDELKGGRAYIWSIAWKAMQFYGWLGSGLGTFHFAYLPFQDPSSQGWFYHAESLYAQCGVELGYLGLFVLVVATLRLLAGIQRPAAKENWGAAFPSKLAGAYLVVSQGLHSFVDFAIIIPALFVPACALMGSVQGTLLKAEIAPPRKRNRTRSEEAITVPETKLPNWKAKGIVAISLALVASLSIVGTTGALHSLAMSESISDWTKIEDKKKLEDQSVDRLGEIAAIWARGNASLKENPAAMRSFADSLLFNYRMNQLVSAPPTGTWEESWVKTSLVFLRLALDLEKDETKKAKIVESVGGKKAWELVEKSAGWYALGQTKSPLDWRLLWGRCFANLVCEKNEIAQLLPASLTLAKHNSQQLLSVDVLFPDHFDRAQVDQILSQAMKSNVWTAPNAARILAMRRSDGEIPIKIFPQRHEVLRSVASEALTRDLFPKTIKQFWEKAIELVATAPMTKSGREVWLADAWSAIGDVKKEITHLRLASIADPSNGNLKKKLIFRLCDAADSTNRKEVITEVKSIIRKHKDMQSQDPDIKALEDRLGQLEQLE